MPDLKPRSIKVTGPGRVAILGARRARLSNTGRVVRRDVRPRFDDDDDAEGMLGTPRYMAPEQIQRVQQGDIRTEVWALGVTLFEILTGKSPFTANDAASRFRAIVEDPIPSVRSVRAEVPRRSTLCSERHWPRTRPSGIRMLLDSRLNSAGCYRA